MPLQKQPATINFNMGVDTKSNPNELTFGKFLSLVNSVFNKLEQLTKRNGFGALTPLPDKTSSFLTTFNSNLTAVGTNLKAFSPGPGIWTMKGQLHPLQLSTMPLVRNSTNQSQADIAISVNGLICTAYTDNIPSGSTTVASYRYVIADATTGQNLVAPTVITSTFGKINFAPRVFSLGNYFILMFSATSGSTSHLQYVPISTYSPSSVGSITDFSTSFTPASTGSFDGAVVNNSLYVSWNGAANSGIKASSLNRFLSQSSAKTIASNSATIVNVTADQTGATPVIWTSTYVNGSNSGYVVATNQNLNTLFSAKQFFSSASGQILNIATSAQNASANIYYEISNAYQYDPNVPTNFIDKRSVSQTGSLSAQSTLVRSVGLASKTFLISSTDYFLTAYSSPYQPSYFVVNGSGQTVAKLAYSNGGGYVTTGLGSAYVNNNTAQFSYLIKDSIEAVNKDTNVPSGTQVAGIYSQTGINLATVTFGTTGLVTSEIGSNLNLNGGFLWMYDGYTPVEQNFHLWPDSVELFVANTGGSMSAQQYYYQATYEWADNQGNVFRSAPSIPVTATAASNTSQITVTVPTMRITYKTANPLKIVLYRWSTAQQVYYQVTSIAAPILNDTTIDFVQYTDMNTDAQILGNNILYTNGGVVENIGPPAATAMTLFDSRLWLIDAEDQNLLWFSKQVIESTPVEMSDLFTLYITPNASAEGPTGPLQCLAPMDDKLILFKRNAIYYINGTGPDNTGANNQYSQAIFVTSTIGCSNQNSIVLMPNGLMFQSDKGIWLLGRDLSTKYIGQEVEAFNSDTVLSAVAVPGVNEVRFTMQSGVTLLYDYFVSQWGIFEGIQGISSTIYNGLHTYINSRGLLYQETPGVYLDGANPVLMSFLTGWINLAGLQGYKRIYKMYMLAEYQSPHRLAIGVAYDFDSAITQSISITPDNANTAWGSDQTWGSGSPWGGPTQREQWQINFAQQQCQSFQLSFNEFYDPSIGQAPGAGLTISGMTIVAGVKKSFPGNIAPSHRKS